MSGCERWSETWEMGPDGLPVCQSRDGCFADTIAVNSLTVTLCFYPEALRVCWHILVWAFHGYVLFQLSVTDKLSDGIVLSVMYCGLTLLMPSARRPEESERNGCDGWKVDAVGPHPVVRFYWWQDNALSVHSYALSPYKVRRWNISNQQIWLSKGLTNQRWAWLRLASQSGVFSDRCFPAAPLLDC